MSDDEWEFIDNDDLSLPLKTAVDETTRRLPRMGVGCTTKDVQQAQKEKFQKERIERKLIGKLSTESLESNTSSKRSNEDIDSEGEELTKSSILSKGKPVAAEPASKLSKTQRRRASKKAKTQMPVTV